MGLYKLPLHSPVPRLLPAFNAFFLCNVEKLQGGAGLGMYEANHYMHMTHGWHFFVCTICTFQTVFVHNTVVGHSLSLFILVYMWPHLFIHQVYYHWLDNVWEINTVHHWHRQRLSPWNVKQEEAYSCISILAKIEGRASVWHTRNCMTWYILYIYSQFCAEFGLLIHSTSDATESSVWP